MIAYPAVDLQVGDVVAAEEGVLPAAATQRRVVLHDHLVKRAVLRQTLRQLTLNLFTGRLQHLYKNSSPPTHVKGRNTNCKVPSVSWTSPNAKEYVMRQKFRTFGGGLQFAGGTVGRSFMLLLSWSRGWSSVNRKFGMIGTETKRQKYKYSQIILEQTFPCCLTCSLLFWNARWNNVQHEKSLLGSDMWTDILGLDNQQIFLQPAAKQTTDQNT